MKSKKCLFLLLTASLLASAGNAKEGKAKKHSSPAGAPATQSNVDQYSGMYSFLKEGEFVQLTIEQGQLSGFVSRMGDLDSDRGVFLDQFFDEGNITANRVRFVTKPVHGTWFEFDGHLDRGPAKTTKEEGYWVLNGTLKQFSSDVERKVSMRSREVTFKSFPLDDGSGDEEQAPPDKK